MLRQIPRAVRLLVVVNEDEEWVIPSPNARLG
jgi:hypothetical protein